MTKINKHIVLISVDTLRADCIKSSPRYGEFLNKHKVSVNLDTQPIDQILKSGIYYNNCLSAAPYTSASHASYFTGFFPLHHNVYEYFNRRLNKTTIFEYAKRVGYKTIFKTDFPIILGQYLGFRKGIDKYYIEDENSALNELLKSKDNKTLSFFHFAGVHYPYGFHNIKYGGIDYTKKVTLLEKKCESLLKDQGKLVDVLDETFRQADDRKLLLRYKSVIEVLYKHQKYDDLFNLYLEGINYFFQKRFNKFLGKIKKFVDENNGLLVIFSDHGEEWDKQSYGHHNSLSESVLRVPLIIYWKGASHRTTEHLVRTIDLAPTILPIISGDYANIKLDGKSLNIFNNNKISLLNRIALAQVWLTNVEKSELFNFQKKAVSKNKIDKPLPTRLACETICNEQCRLTISYNKGGLITSKKFVDYLKSATSADHSLLEKTLKKYNLSKSVSGLGLKSISHTIRQQLENLGYRV